MNHGSRQPSAGGAKHWKCGVKSCNFATNYVGNPFCALCGGKGRHAQPVRKPPASGSVSQTASQSTGSAPSGGRGAGGGGGGGGPGWQSVWHGPGWPIGSPGLGPPPPPPPHHPQFGWPGHYPPPWQYASSWPAPGAAGVGGVGQQEASQRQSSSWPSPGAAGVASSWPSPGAAGVAGAGQQAARQQQVPAAAAGGGGGGGGKGKGNRKRQAKQASVDSSPAAPPQPDLLVEAVKQALGSLGALLEVDLVKSIQPVLDEALRRKAPADPAPTEQGLFNKLAKCRRIYHKKLSQAENATTTRDEAAKALLVLDANMQTKVAEAASAKEALFACESAYFSATGRSVRIDSDSSEGDQEDEDDGDDEDSDGGDEGMGQSPKRGPADPAAQQVGAGSGKGSRGHSVERPLLLALQQTAAVRPRPASDDEGTEANAAKHQRRLPTAAAPPATSTVNSFAALAEYDEPASYAGDDDHEGDVQRGLARARAIAKSAADLVEAAKRDAELAPGVGGASASGGPSV